MQCKDKTVHDATPQQRAGTKENSDGETKTKCLHPEFKTEVVLEALRGESSQSELCRRHNLILV